MGEFNDNLNKAVEILMADETEWPKLYAKMGQRRLPARAAARLREWQAVDDHDYEEECAQIRDLEMAQREHAGEAAYVSACQTRIEQLKERRETRGCGLHRILQCLPTDLVAELAATPGMVEEVPPLQFSLSLPAEGTVIQSNGPGKAPTQFSMTQDAQGTMHVLVENPVFEEIPEGTYHPTLNEYESQRQVDRLLGPRKKGA